MSEDQSHLETTEEAMASMRRSDKRELRLSGEQVELTRSEHARLQGIKRLAGDMARYIQRTSCATCRLFVDSKCSLSSCIIREFVIQAHTLKLDMLSADPAVHIRFLLEEE